MKGKTKWRKLIVVFVALSLVMMFIQPQLLADTTDGTYTISWSQEKLPGFNVAYQSSAKAGERAKIYITHYREFAFNSVTVNGQEITEYTNDGSSVNNSDYNEGIIVEFVMPAEDVEFTINATLPVYKITLNKSEHGTAVLDKNTFYPDDEIKLTVKPDEGYEVESIIVGCTDFNGYYTEEDMLYYFEDVDTNEYPIYTGYGDTTVNVSFKKSASPSLTGGIAHVQDIGNKPATTDDSTGILSLGTTGQSKRLESILIDFANPTSYSGALEYRVHVQNIGWMPWTGAGNPVGTSGKALRLEGIEMRLTGELAKHYSVEYCAHIQDYGDAQGWVRDGALAGTTGESKRIEQIKVRIVPIDSDNTTSVNYRVHVQDYGWESKWAANGAMSGTQGQSKRLEGIEIHLGGCQYSGGIRYKTHIQNIGWENTWTQDGEMSGTQGQSLRLEAIKIELYGEMASHYDVYYRVHAQDIGWMSWASNGASAGTAGRSARLEGIQIVLVPKGAAAPGATYQGITAVDSRAFIEGF